MKHFKLSKKSLMSFALSVIMLVSMSSMAMICYAIEWRHPTTNAFNVTLYTDQTKTYSGAKVDPYILFEGRNHSESRKVWFIPQYTFNSDQIGGWKSDVDKKCKLKSAGEYFLDGESTHDYNKPWWRLCLNNYMLGNGGQAYGWCW